LCGILSKDDSRYVILWDADVGAQPSDEKLSIEEKVVLYLLAGSGLLVWVIVAMFFAVRGGSAGRIFGLAPPIAYATANSTPTHVAPPTSTSFPEPTFTVTPVPSPTLTPPPTPIPLGAPMLPIDGDIKVVALLGIDEEHDAAVWRTDSIILAFIDQKNSRLSLLSVPRDLWVHIPGYRNERINTVDALGERTNYPGGGVALFDKMMRFNLGIPVHHYVRVDFQGFIDIIDAMGGVTVDVRTPLADHFPDPTSPSGWAWITLPAGPKHMDGTLALSYCRSRVTTGDFDRSARQQQVLFALWKKALTLETLARAPQLWAQLGEAFDTDLGMTEAVQLAYFAQGLDPDSVQTQHFSYELGRAWTTPDGAQVLLPQTEAIQQAVLDLLSVSE
jgi:LCP family protein required for cell wall assembly